MELLDDPEAVAQSAPAAKALRGAFGQAQPVQPSGLVSRLYMNPEARRVAAFLLAGGVSALVTMTVTQIVLHVDGGHFVLSALLGAEIGILTNFAINDRLAFADLDGHARPMLARLLRFHLACAFGQSLILVLSTILFDVAHWAPSLAQAVPIVIVTAVNFAAHRFWTYRRVSG